MALDFATQAFDIVLVETIGVRNVSVDSLFIALILINCFCMLQKVIDGGKNDFLTLH